MNNKPFDVICVGSALLDVYMKSDKFVKVPSGEVAGGVALCEEFGGKTEVEEVVVCSGGGGSNNAVSFARKGFITALVTEVGDDLVGATILEELRREKVNTSMAIQEKDEQTGISSIMVALDGGRSVAVHRGASRMLNKDDIDWDRLQAEWIVISSLGGEMDLFEGLIGHAKHNGIRVAVNPGRSELEKVNDWGGLGLFAEVDVLMLNREEAQILVNEPFVEQEYWATGAGIFTNGYVVITSGKEGGRVCYKGDVIDYVAEKVNVVEETGAGDAFGSGFVSALMKGRDVSEAIEWGRRQAAAVVGYMGAKRGLLSFEELEVK